MQEHEIRALLAENIKKYRNMRGWSQLHLSEKLGISPNFLSEIEIGKRWVSSKTLSKLSIVLDVDIIDFFKPIANNTTQDEAETDKMKRFTKDIAEAIGVSIADAAKDLNNIVSKVCKEYFG